MKGPVIQALAGAIQVALAICLIAAVPGQARARPGDEDDCRSQRKMFPANWKDTSRDLAILTCQGHSDVAATIRIGRAAQHDKYQISITTDGRIYRAVTTREFIVGILAGKDQRWFARGEDSCASNFTQDNVVFVETALEGGEFRITFLVGGSLRWASCQVHAPKKF